MVKLCANDSIKKDYIHGVLCEDVKKKGFKNDVLPDSFIEHMWAATWTGSQKVFKKKETISIFDIVPNLVSVSERLGLKCD